MAAKGLDFTPDNWHNSVKLQREHVSTLSIHLAPSTCVFNSLTVPRVLPSTFSPVIELINVWPHQLFKHKTDVKRLHLGFLSVNLLPLIQPTSTVFSYFDRWLQHTHTHTHTHSERLIKHITTVTPAGHLKPWDLIPGLGLCGVGAEWLPAPPTAVTPLTLFITSPRGGGGKKLKLNPIQRAFCSGAVPQNHRLRAFRCHWEHLHCLWLVLFSLCQLFHSSPLYSWLCCVCSHLSHP